MEKLWQLETSLKQPFGHITALAMEEQMANCDFGLKDANVNIPKKSVWLCILTGNQF